MRLWFVQFLTEDMVLNKKHIQITWYKTLGAGFAVLLFCSSSRLPILKGPKTFHHYWVADSNSTLISDVHSDHLQWDKSISTAVRWNSPVGQQTFACTCDKSWGMSRRPYLVRRDAARAWIQRACSLLSSGTSSDSAKMLDIGPQHTCTKQKCWVHQIWVK